MHQLLTIVVPSNRLAQPLPSADEPFDANKPTPTEYRRIVEDANHAATEFVREFISTQNGGYSDWHEEHAGRSSARLNSIYGHQNLAWYDWASYSDSDDYSVEDALQRLEWDYRHGLIGADELRRNLVDDVEASDEWDSGEVEEGTFQQNVVGEDGEHLGYEFDFDAFQAFVEAHSAVIEANPDYRPFNMDNYGPSVDGSTKNYDEVPEHPNRVVLGGQGAIEQLQSSWESTARELEHARDEAVDELEDSDIDPRELFELDPTTYQQQVGDLGMFQHWMNSLFGYTPKNECYGYDAGAHTGIVTEEKQQTAITAIKDGGAVVCIDVHY
ncbi:hypothetical protein [Halosegnis longus]|uniref:hypothetical protein n=1 Tax=Halosegnis longus TaxID=2216012 RepID=UPI00129D2B7B|nr:hypothetical protein [Halosegnis longus]